MTSVTQNSAQRRGLSALLAVAVSALLMIVVGVSTADAAFSLSRCTGSNVQGRGAAFQKTAQQDFWKVYFDTFGNPGCVTGTLPQPTVTYDPAGSGAGRNAFGQTGGVRDPAIRYIAFDEAPTNIQRTNMENGLPGDPNDNGKLRVIPVGAGATTVIVNFPSGCQVPVGSGSYASYARVQFPNVMLEKIWRGDSTADTWGEATNNDIIAIPGGGRSDGGCKAQAMKRVVRFDSSGTTFSFKQVMKKINPFFNWAENDVPPLTNTSWPNNVAPTAVLNGGANGNGPLAQKVKNTDGSIGYVDLATARANGFRKQQAGGGLYNFASWGDFWIPLEQFTGANPTPGQVSGTNPSSGVFSEPTKNANAIVTGTKGANCQSVKFANIPGDAPGNAPDAIDPYGDWSTVNGTAHVDKYPLCTLTYIGIWDDYADVYGNTPVEEAKARTVKDYAKLITSFNGQQYLTAFDYYPLANPPSQDLYNHAANSVAAMDWNKP